MDSDPEFLPGTARCELSGVKRREIDQRGGANVRALVSANRPTNVLPSPTQVVRYYRKTTRRLCVYTVRRVHTGHP